METLQRISKTDLARKTRQVLRNVQRGQTTIVESHGEAEVAILDIVDYRILRAAAQSSVTVSGRETVAGLDSQALAMLVDEQERYNRVIGAYLGEDISLARAAELLDLPVIDLRFRLLGLGLPLRMGTEDRDQLLQDIDAVASLGK